MQASPSFQTASLSQAGSREVNEDCLAFNVAGPLCYWILCDGLGGHGSGDVAAQTAVAAISERARLEAQMDTPTMVGLFTYANDALMQAQAKEAARVRMYSTAVVFCANGRQAIWGHIGDSRLYHFRHAQVQSQTLDHSLVQANINAGNLPPSALRFHEDRSRLLRSLGSGGEIKVTIPSAHLELEAGDAFLLASDGFWELVLESEMESTLSSSATAQEWLDQMHSVLQLRAANVEDCDNYSAIAIRVELLNHD
jgi:PPM family protein phosphatase